MHHFKYPMVVCSGGRFEVANPETPPRFISILLLGPGVSNLVGGEYTLDSACLL